MREFLRWVGPALQRTYDRVLSAPLSWKIIDAHEKLREAEEKKGNRETSATVEQAPRDREKP